MAQKTGSIDLLNIDETQLQYFWHQSAPYSDNIPAGTYVTQVTEEEFKNNPTGQPNLLLRSNSVNLRSGKDIYLQAGVIEENTNLTGIKIFKGGLEAGTFNSDDYIYAWGGEDRNDRTISINSSGNKKDWRLLAGKKFGVDKAGNLYAKDVHISGTVTVGAGSNVYTTDDVNPLLIGGRNLHKDSEDLGDSWAKDYGASVSNGVATIVYTAGQNCRIYQMPANGYWGIWEANTTYTISVEAKANTNGVILSLEPYAGGIPGKSCSLTTEWKRYSYTFTSNNTTSTSSCTYRVTSNGTVQLRKPKLEKGNKATDWTPAPEDLESYADNLQAQARPFVMGTQTAATGTWTGVCNELTELKEGQEILYFLPYNGSGNATLNLTLGNGTTTGAINCYYQNTSRLTTHFGAGMTIPLVYHKNFNIGGTNYTGWWTLSQYNTNNVDRKQMANAIRVGENHAAYCISARSGTGHKKVVSGLAIDLSYPICYLNQANISGQSYAVASGGTTTNFYTAIPSVTLRNNVANWTGTQYAMCYLKGTLAGNTFTVHSDVFTTVVPTSDDGFAYIPIGMTYSTYQVNFACDNSIYGYKNGSFGPLANREASAAQATANAAAPKTSAVKRTQRIYYQNNSTTAPATPGNASSNWVTDNTGAANKWTKKRMSYASATPYIWTCEQSENAAGTVSYTTVLLDDTTTVIDGGKIITGSILANAIKADSGQFNSALIPNLDASKITTGTINIGRVPGGALNTNVQSQNFAQGTMMYKDPTFASGVNSTTKYANQGPNNVTWTRAAKSSDNPMTGTSYEMVAKNTGTASPGLGGFYFNHASRANAVFLYRIIAKIPTGRKIQFASNATGDSPVRQWLTPQDGTGKFTEYVCKQICGSTGTFSGSGYFYIDGNPGTTSAPVTWYVAYATVFDMSTVSELNNYVGITSSGIRIASANPNSQNQRIYITNDALRLYDKNNVQRLLLNESGVTVGQITNGKAHTTIKDDGLHVWNGVETDANNEVAIFTSSGSRIGIPNQTHLKMNFNGLQLFDKETAQESSPTPFFEVQDLRNQSGQAPMKDFFISDGTQTAFDLSLKAYTANYTVTSNGVPTSLSSQTIYGFTFSTPAIKGTQIVAEYITQDRNAKAFTFGSRKTSGSVGGYSVVLGQDVIASGFASHAEGYQTTASGFASHAEGKVTKAIDDSAHAEGEDTTASGWYSHAEGYKTTAFAAGTHAEGVNTTASWYAAHAEGRNTTASRSAAHAEGDETTASGHYSHAEGSNTTASGTAAHAEGDKTTASGYCSHAEGYKTTASGTAAHAEGSCTTASGSDSHAGGYGTRAIYDCQTIIGRYNDNQIITLFEIGNGYSDSSRSNALGVYRNGNITIALDTNAASGEDFDIYNALTKLKWNNDCIVS